MNEKEHDSETNSRINCVMIIEILNDTILHGLPLASTSKHTLQYNTDLNVENVTFKHIISKYRLDFKQGVAFEVMSCSFILKSLKNQHITEDVLEQFLHKNKDNQNKSTDGLKGFKKSLKDKGGEKHLIMFLSGMGGTGKSEVIKAFMDFVKGISKLFD